jgi:N6-L-threonylcarbamoyladenine synthase
VARPDPNSAEEKRRSAAVRAHPATTSTSVVKRVGRGGALRSLRNSTPTGDNPPGIRAGKQGRLGLGSLSRSHSKPGPSFQFRRSSRTPTLTAPARGGSPYPISQQPTVYFASVHLSATILKVMLILGIETSCDETAASVVEDGRRALSNVVASQIDIHREYGGVVPEVAARSHIEVVLPVVHEALAKAKVTWDDIDGIAVTYGPGLLGSLLIGTLTARTIALARNKPLYAVNHVVAHTFANFLIDPQPQFPMLSLSASGKHSDLLLFESPLEYKLLGQTRDDAAGEAFDKVARMLGFEYPGGPKISKLAPHGDEQAFKLPVAQLSNPYDFSFSGLKTAVLRTLQTTVGGDFRTLSTEIPAKLTEKQKADMAASFQRTVCETLAGKLLQAYHEFKPRSVVIAGGVAANTRLREEVTKQLPVNMTYAPMEYCTDNAAMIAAFGYHLAQAGRTADPLTLTTDPSLAV